MAETKSTIGSVFKEYFADSVIDNADVSKEWVHDWLHQLQTASGEPLESEAFARGCDGADPLASFRSKFHIPQHEGKDVAYFCGNSLGLQPTSTQQVVMGELTKWAKVGVEGHFTGDIPWATCEELLPELCKDIVGADDAALEIGFSNSLTVNLHLMMVAFYRPTDKRNKIMIEAAAFPSDRYATVSQIVHHGLDPKECLIEVTPADDVAAHTENYGVISTQRIMDQITKHKDELKLVMLSGIQYVTGQKFDMEKITAHVHSINKDLPENDRIYIGWDLAHAAGNVPLKLHEWGVDFAAWCTYKYLNSGAGCLAGMFLHSKHATTPMKELPRFAGWWGVPIAKRFKMAQEMECSDGVSSFICSNVPPIMVACIKPSLEVFKEAGGIRMTRHKSFLATGYLESLLHALEITTTKSADAHAVAIVTPTNPIDRGCQLSLRITASKSKAPMTMNDLEKRLGAVGVTVDAREPDIIRVAPCPLYNSFHDVYTFAQTLKQVLAQ